MLLGAQQYFSSPARERNRDGNVYRPQPAASSIVSCLRPVAADQTRLAANSPVHHKQSHGRKPPCLRPQLLLVGEDLDLDPGEDLPGFTMAEVEPGGTEEQVEVGEEPVEVAETRISLTNAVGSVFRAHRLDKASASK